MKNKMNPMSYLIAATLVITPFASNAKADSLPHSRVAEVSAISKFLSSGKTLGVSEHGDTCNVEFSHKVTAEGYQLVSVHIGFPNGGGIPVTFDGNGIENKDRINWFPTFRADSDSLEIDFRLKEVSDFVFIYEHAEHNVLNIDVDGDKMTVLTGFDPNGGLMTARCIVKAPN